MGWFSDEPKKRTLGVRDKKILYVRAKGKCEACGKKIEFHEMHAGHKNPAFKGGSATLRNTVCICASCNGLQGKDSWAVFMKKLGKNKTRSITSGKKKEKTQKAKKIFLGFLRCALLTVGILFYKQHPPIDGWKSFFYNFLFFLKKDYIALQFFLFFSFFTSHFI